MSAKEGVSRTCMNKGTKKLNWSTELDVNDEESRSKLLCKVRQLEKGLIKKGYRWYRIRPTYQVLVPCDEEGNPTEEGLKKIQKHKDMLNIV